MNCNIYIMRPSSATVCFILVKTLAESSSGVKVCDSNLNLTFSPTIDNGVRQMFDVTLDCFLI